MNEQNRAALAFHGTGVFLFGLLAGVPYALVVGGQMVGEERAWRMAHLEGLLSGLLMLAVGGVGSALRLSVAQERALVIALSVAGYVNTFAAILGAATGNRGLALGGSVWNLLVLVGFMVAVVAVFVAVALVMLGARALRR